MERECIDCGRLTYNDRLRCIECWKKNKDQAKTKEYKRENNKGVPIMEVMTSQITLPFWMIIAIVIGIAIVSAKIW